MVLRIKLRYPDIETFIAAFSVNVGRLGLFLPTRALRPVGSDLRFELRLLDDRVALSGFGRVSAVREPHPDEPAAPYGMAIEFRRVTRESRDLVMRMLEHRRAAGMGEPELPLPEATAPPAARPPAALEAPASEAQVAQEPAREHHAALPTARPDVIPAPLPAEPARRPRRRAADLLAELGASIGAPDDATAELRELNDADLNLERALRRAKQLAGDATEEDLAALQTPEEEAEERRAAPARERAAPTERTPPDGRAPPPAAPDHQTGAASASSRRPRVSRPKRLTQPASVFSRTRTDELTDEPDEPRAEPAGAQGRPGDAPEPAPAPEAAGARARPEWGDAPEPRPELAGARARPEWGDAPELRPSAPPRPAFERVLAELEASPFDPPTVPGAQPASLVREGHLAPRPQIEELVLEDLDQLARTRELGPSDPSRPLAHDDATGDAPWPPEDTAPVPPTELDDVQLGRLRSAPRRDPTSEVIEDLEEAGFEILSEEDLIDEGDLDALDEFDIGPWRSPRSPQERAAAFAAAVARPTWSRTPDLDEHGAAPGELDGQGVTPPTIPGRVPTREIDLESALDALDIESDAAPPVPSVAPRHDDDEDDFPIELEFDE
ncbi:MAG: hypothetical protein R3B48_10900 [Kofleriaceae bacterium]